MEEQKLQEINKVIKTKYSEIKGSFMIRIWDNRGNFTLGYYNNGKDTLNGITVFIGNANKNILIYEHKSFNLINDTNDFYEFIHKI
jgi:hypothetical protein